LTFGSMSSSFSFAIDRGGTFTDVFCVLPGKRATCRGFGFLTSIKFVRLSF
jgi:N-methylhydantoinase A/oxoprolinase/acetone carboxylase beta subunit